MSPKRNAANIVYNKLKGNGGLRNIIVGVLLYTALEIIFHLLELLRPNASLIHVAPGSVFAQVPELAKQAAQLGLKGIFEASKWIVRSITISLIISAITNAIKDIDVEMANKFQGLFRVKPHQYDKVAIVVSDFDRDYFMNYLTNDGYGITTPNPPPTNANNKRFLSLGDVYASKYISILFQKILKYSPDLITGEEALKAINKTPGKYEHFILIGLHSNTVCNSLIFGKDANGNYEYDSITMDSFITKRLRFAPGARTNDAGKRTVFLRRRQQTVLNPRAVDETNETDICIFSTFQLPNRPFQFTLIAGLNATGTEVLARKIQEDWQTLAEDSIAFCETGSSKKVRKPLYAVGASHPVTKVFVIQKKDTSTPLTGYDPKNSFLEFDNNSLI